MIRRRLIELGTRPLIRDGALQRQICCRNVITKPLNGSVSTIEGVETTYCTSFHSTRKKRQKHGQWVKIPAAAAAAHVQWYYLVDKKQIILLLVRLYIVE